MKIYSNSKPNADHRSDKRISSTNIRYKGYMIRLDRGGDGYNVYDKYGELEDAGYPSLASAKNFVDELVANDDVYSDIYSSSYRSEVTAAFHADDVVDEFYCIYELIEADDGHEELDCVEVQDDKYLAIKFAELYSTQNNCPTRVVQVSTTDSGDTDTEVVWESFMKMKKI